MTEEAASPELEVKLRLPRNAVAALLAHRAVIEHKAGRVRTRRITSTYFDTPRLRLAKKGIGLRMRRDGKRWIQAVKGPPGTEAGAGLAARFEYEWSIRGATKRPDIDTARLATTPWRRVLLKATRIGLAPVFVTDFVRTELSLALNGGTTAALCIDVGSIRGAQSKRRIGICEVELELASGQLTALIEFARTLAAELPLALEPASKAARGVQLVCESPPQPLHAESIALAEGTNAREALASIARSCLRQIEGNIDGALNDDDPEWIHQMRIGTRRLRACLSLLRDGDGVELVALRRDVKWLAAALGTARDLDVLALQTLPSFRRAARGTIDTAPSTALRRFAATVGKRRKAARNAARDAVASRRFVQTMLTAARIAATPDFGISGEAAREHALESSARGFAADILARRQRKLVHLSVSLPDAPADLRHAARIAAKKLRYATEFFAPLFSRKRASRYRDALTDLQDVLGELNDAAMAAQLASDIAGAQSPIAAALHGFNAGQTLRCKDDLVKAWRRFCRCKPFWE